MKMTNRQDTVNRPITIKNKVFRYEIGANETLAQLCFECKNRLINYEGPTRPKDRPVCKFVKYWIEEYTDTVLCYSCKDRNISNHPHFRQRSPRDPPISRFPTPIQFYRDNEFYMDSETCIPDARDIQGLKLFNTKSSKCNVHLSKVSKNNKETIFSINKKK